MYNDHDLKEIAQTLVEKQYSVTDYDFCLPNAMNELEISKLNTFLTEEQALFRVKYCEYNEQEKCYDYKTVEVVHE